MKRLLVLFISFFLGLYIYGCDKEKSGMNFSDDPEINRLLEQSGATKYLNNFDYDCSWYIPEAIHTEGIDVSLSIDFEEKSQGTAGLKCTYSFPEVDRGEASSSFTLRKVWGNFRSDLSFSPLAISVMVKSTFGNSDKLKVSLLVQNDDFTLGREEFMVYTYEDETILNRDGWQRLILPYAYFKPDQSTYGTLNLSRVTGYQLSIESGSPEAHSATVCFDALEQLTSFKPEFKTTARFSSIFIQLHASVNLTTNWVSTFESYLEVGIDTMIIQHASRNREGQGIFHYKGSKLPWKKEEYSMIDKMFAAAEQTGMKLIVGLNGGGYPVDKSDAPVYDELYERNKEVLDELYDKFADSPAMAGWYITEEFHDGGYRGWWKYEDRMLLAHYQQRVAAYAKSKPRKFIVTIAPALWRGRPADMAYDFFRTFFEKTPDIDILYLQDCGGRCYVDGGDFDVDLANYFAQIKKACDETGVQFGVDIESFERCACEDIGWSSKSWEELKSQLDIAGLFTENLTQFSWTSFRPGKGAFDAYKEYLEEQGLLKKSVKND